MREVKIKKAMNGFIVHVGCQTLVFETRAALIVALDRYLEKPESVEKEYLEKYDKGVTQVTQREYTTDSPYVFYEPVTTVTTVTADFEAPR